MCKHRNGKKSVNTVTSAFKCKLGRQWTQMYTKLQSCNDVRCKQRCKQQTLSRHGQDK